MSLTHYRKFTCCKRTNVTKHSVVLKKNKENKIYVIHPTFVRINPNGRLLASKENHRIHQYLGSCHCTVTPLNGLSGTSD